MQAQDVELFYERLGWGADDPRRQFGCFDLRSADYERLTPGEKRDLFHAGCAFFCLGLLDADAIALLSDLHFKLCLDKADCRPDARLGPVARFVSLLARQVDADRVARLTAFDPAASSIEGKRAFAHDFAVLYGQAPSHEVIFTRRADFVSLLRGPDPGVACIGALEGLLLTDFLRPEEAVEAARIAVDHPDFTWWHFEGLVETLDRVHGESSTAVLARIAYRVGSMPLPPTATKLRARLFHGFLERLLRAVSSRVVEPDVIDSLRDFLERSRALHGE